MILLRSMYPERIIPDNTEPGIVATHLVRYAFALPYVRGGSVLDAACGVGYGSAFLADTATHVTGVDSDEETIEYARRRYGAANVEFRPGDVCRLPDADGSYDAVCSFETIEHVDEPERAIAEFARVLRPGGVLVISTPNAPSTTRQPANPFHQIEWSAADFAQLLATSFVEVELYGQSRRQTGAHRLAQRLDVLGLRRRFTILRRGARLLGTAPTAELTLADLVIERGTLDRASEVVAVCRTAQA